MSASGEEAPARPVAAPYLFHVEKVGGKVALSGFYPDADAHSKIVTAAAKAFPGSELVDQLKQAGGAPTGFVDAALGGLAQLARLRSGALDLHDRNVRLSGEAGGAEAADDVRARLEKVQLSGYSVNAEIAAPPTRLAAAAPRAVDRAVRPARLDARACQANMAALVKDAPIVFRLGSALLDPDSARTLDAVAEEAKRCPDVEFEIAGHTDDIGYVSENLELSRRRAESVLVYLVAVGVPPYRLTAIGYGETRPLVANVNDDNRARNRRIEFNLK
jgi:OOP family OmpA-OmpF porin